MVASHKARFSGLSVSRTWSFPPKTVAAAREWRGPPGAEKLRLLNGEGVDMSHDAGTMIPLAPPET